MIQDLKNYLPAFVQVLPNDDHKILIQVVGSRFLL